MARRAKWTGTISTGISLLLAGLILAQFIVPDMPEHQVHKTKPEPVPTPDPVQKPQPIPAALVLPAPPKPAPAKALPKVAEMKSQSQKTVQESPKPPVAPKRIEKVKAAPKPEPKPQPQMAPAKPKAPATYVPAAADVVEGRALLRTLEHGKGPLIEIAWPDDRSQHGRLFQHMTSCLGMRVAVMDKGSHLFVAEDASGKPWEINLDRYSGFLRQPTGWLSPSERKAEAMIRKHHNMTAHASGVRIFPRKVDAALLGGLRNYIGDRYGQAKSIRARYRLNGNVVIVEGLSVDGKAVAGRIGLKAQTSRCAWRT